MRFPVIAAGLTLLAISAMPTTADAYELTCQSKEKVYNRCNLNRSRDMDVELVRKLDNSKKCERDRTWGVDGDGIWVDKGCKAVFEVRERGNAYAEKPGRDGTVCPYAKGSNECSYWKDGYGKGISDARANMSRTHQRHKNAYDSRFESAFAEGYRAGWDAYQRLR